MADKKARYLGFDLGGTKMLAAVVDEDFKILATEKKKTKPELGTEAGLDRMRKCIDAALKNADVAPEDLKGIGFGLPGVLDLEKGRVVRLLNVGWEDVPICDHFREIYKTPVVIDNDVNTGTYGEYRCGAGKGHKDIVGIFPGTGIGGGIIVGGRLHHGVTGGAAEIGHLCYDARGPHCACGARGCYEAWASRVAIAANSAAAVFRGLAPNLAEAAGTDLKEIRSGALAKAIKQGDKVIEEIVREAAYAVGQLAADMIVTLSPSMILLGGGLVEAMEDLYLEECRRAVKNHAMKELREPVTVAAAKLGDNAVVLGAAALAMDAEI